MESSNARRRASFHRFGVRLATTVPRVVGAKESSQDQMIQLARPSDMVAIDNTKSRR